MGDRDPPQITSCKLKSYTKISFKPDLKRFGMDVLTDDTVALMTKRVHDIAGCNPALKVSFNGERLVYKSFSKYCETYVSDPTKPKFAEKPHERWEICISLSDSGEFQQCSYVNSIW